MKTQILRPLLFLLPFIISCCKGQNSTIQNSTIDTASLFNPKKKLNEDLSSQSFSFAKNSMIVLSNDFYGFRLNNELFEVVKSDSLIKLINSNKTQILSERFYIYTDSSVLFNDILYVIKNLKTIGIENYRVINSQSYFNDPRTLSSIAIPIKNISPKINSSFLILKFRDNKFNVTFYQIDTTLQTIKDLDAFFDANKSKILNEKIILDFETNSPKEIYKGVKEILKKYNYTKFRIKTND